jgi:hypothetical protein
MFTQSVGINLRNCRASRPRSCSPNNPRMKTGEMFVRQFNSNIRQIYRECTTHVEQFYPSAFGYNASCDVVTQFSSYVTVCFRSRLFSEIKNILTVLTSFIPCHGIYFLCTYKMYAGPSGRSSAEIVGSNPTEGMDVCLL